MPIEYVEIISVVSVVCTILGVVVGMSNLRRNQRHDDKNEGAQFTRIEVQLEHISRRTDDIADCISDIKDEIKEHRERIVRAEESTKQAHKRLDELAGRRGAGVSA